MQSLFRLLNIKYVVLTATSLHLANNLSKAISKLLHVFFKNYLIDVGTNPKADISMKLISN